MQYSKQQICAFCNNNKRNVTLVTDEDAQEVVGGYELLLLKKHADVTILDLGGVAVFTSNGVLVGWVDYENCWGYIA